MIEFDEAWNQKHDPQRQTPAGFCKVCGGEIFELDTLDAYDGLCPACWWAENGEEYDGENSGRGRGPYGDEGRTGNARPYDGGEGD